MKRLALLMVRTPWTSPGPLHPGTPKERSETRPPGKRPGGIGQLAGIFRMYADSITASSGEKGESGSVIEDGPQRAHPTPSPTHLRRIASIRNPTRLRLPPSLPRKGNALLPGQPKEIAVISRGFHLGQVGAALQALPRRPRGQNLVAPEGEQGYQPTPSVLTAATSK